ncbi:MAG: hypothetical protein AAF318_05165 [Pseudomonadota bacterium]
MANDNDNDPPKPKCTPTAEAIAAALCEINADAPTTLHAIPLPRAKVSAALAVLRDPAFV